jgi:protein gp37
MAAKTTIEWTEQTWNPTTGCTKIPPGCQNCYAEVMARRLKAMGVKGYENGFALTLQPHRLHEPLQRKKPTMYFVNSMSDLFHEEVPNEYICKVFEVIRLSPKHTFQILTKRANRMAEFLNCFDVPQNAWIGVTVEILSSNVKKTIYPFFSNNGAVGESTVKKELRRQTEECYSADFCRKTRSY